MSIELMAVLAATMLATAFLSGMFGMAGGMILMGVLLFLLPLPEAMALHAITQIASNAWRGVLWIAFVRWRPALMFLAGCALAFAVWSVWRYTPDKGLALVLLGASPFIVRLVPEHWRPDPNKLLHGIGYGGVSMSLMLTAGVSGPLVDSYFLGGKFDRREIVATKAVCQVVSHGAKFVYFGSLVDQSAAFDPVMGAIAVAASIAGTSLARPILERLTDVQYRRWATRIITTIAAVYLVRGGYLLMQ